VKVRRSIDIGARPEQVYDLIMDPKRLKDWVSIHHRLEEAPTGSLEKGSEVTQWLKLGGQKFKVRWTVVENDPCKRVVWEGKGPITSHARVVYGFEPSGDGTRFSYTNEYDLPGGALGRIAGRTVKRVTSKAVDGSLQNLKSLIE
jgi:carbon monoxide dehydrogenase subunit G